MKTKIYLIAITIIIAFQCQLMAQNQSILLPFSGDTYPSTGSKMLNFTNPINPGVESLPKHSFSCWVGGSYYSPADPHVEAQLQAASATYPINIYLFNEKYLGQHPMMAQNVVHDKDGNLLFFIVDNNIYNRKGEAFHYIDPDNPNGPPDPDLYTYLHGGELGMNYDRFSFFSLEPEIAIFPLIGECYKFGIVYSTYDHAAQHAAYTVYYETLEYRNENEIVLSDQKTINLLFPGQIGAQPCKDHINKGIAVSEYRPAEQNYYLFIRLVTKLCVFKINNTGIVDEDNDGQITYLDAENIDIDNMAYMPHFQTSSELEVKKVVEGANSYYYVGMGTCSKDQQNPGVSEAMINVVKLNYDDATEVSQFYNILPTTLPDPHIEQIKGLEFSPNGSKLFVTYTGQTGLGYVDISSQQYQLFANISNQDEYQFSEIELGRDNNLYYLHTINDESSGGISRLEDPDNTMVWNSSFSSINKIYYSDDFETPDINEYRTLLFQDQIDGSDYTSYFGTVDGECCTDHLYYSDWPTNDDFTSNQIWTWTPGNCPFFEVNGVIYIENDVEIPSGKEVIMQNLKFKFRANKKLIVNQGAKLVLDNTILTSVDECEQTEMWGGVEVWGNGKQDQLNQQGIVEIINGGTIENALYGIYVGKRDANGALNSGTGGGIVRASGDALFKNCMTGVMFTPYKNIITIGNNSNEFNNASYFINCTFETTDDYYTLSPKAPKSFLILNGIMGLRIQGNTFHNIASSTIPSLNRGNGIISTDASFYVIPGCQTNYIYPCPQPIKNVFENLQYGISVNNTDPTKSITVNNSTFTNNFRGIRIQGMLGANITDNDFDIGASFGPYIQGNYHLSDAYGIHLEGCSGYQVQSNHFSSQTNGYFGAIITNSGQEANLINNNNFNDLIIGSQAEGENGSTPFSTIDGNDPGDWPYGVNKGLLFKCNDYGNNTDADINITIAQLNSGLIDIHQGNCNDYNSPANNTFSGVPVNGNINTGLYVFPFSYSFYNDAAHNPVTNSSLIGKIACSEYDANLTCKLPDNNGMYFLHGIILSRSELISNLEGRIDGGNTQALLDYIGTKPSPEELDAHITPLSPYLSDKVILKSIEYLDTIDHALIAKITIANSPVTLKIMESVNKVNLDSTLKNLVLDAQTGTSRRFLLEDSLTKAQRDLDLATNEMIRNTMNDTAYARVDELISFIDSLSLNVSLSNEYKILYAEAFLSKGNLLSAKDVLGSIDTTDEEIIKNVKYLEILCDSNMIGDSIHLNYTQIQTLQDIMASNTRVSVNARVLLELALDTLFEERIYDVIKPNNNNIKAKVFVQGLYDGNGMMHEALDFDSVNETFSPKWGTGIADKVTLKLYDSTYQTLMASYPDVDLHTDGTITIQSIGSTLKDSYYITIFHRNSVPITSATPISFADTLVSYDFTTPIDQAYGAGLAPQKDLGDGFYGMYTGELDHDEYYFIDGSDVSILDTDVIHGRYGYRITDLNGDGYIDGSDMCIMDANMIFGPLFWNPLIY